MPKMSMENLACSISRSTLPVIGFISFPICCIAAAWNIATRLKKS